MQSRHNQTQMPSSGNRFTSSTWIKSSAKCFREVREFRDFGQDSVFRATRNIANITFPVKQKRIFTNYWSTISKSQAINFVSAPYSKSEQDKSLSPN
jgi:hypothetical protein